MMKSYRVVANLGQGAYGTVLEGICIKTGQGVAIKKIINRRVRDQYQPNPLEREVKCLEILHHPNIVELLDKIVDGSGIVLVFELLTTDLDKVIKIVNLDEVVIKAYMLMLLEGVSYCHSMDIIHRDLKPANILISLTGVLKIADFGLARVYKPGSQRPMSHQVATRWYRSIELLYGSRDYDSGVDLWAVGCIFAEMVNQSPLFPGQSDIEQLLLVLSILGTPDLKTWPGVVDLPDYNKIIIPESHGKTLKVHLPDLSIASVQFLSKFLIYNSKNRVTADEALLDSYFTSDPLPALFHNLPNFPKSVVKDTRLAKNCSFGFEDTLELGC